MSLDVCLTVQEPVVPKKQNRIFVREDGATREISIEEWDQRNPGREPILLCDEGPSKEVFSANITHNLVEMANAAGILKAMWHPKEIGIKTAQQLIAPLEAGLQQLQDDPEKFSALNPSNGWGSYDGLVNFVKKYLAACQAYPEAEVSVSR